MIHLTPSSYDKIRNEVFLKGYQAGLIHGRAAGYQDALQHGQDASASQDVFNNGHTAMTRTPLESVASFSVPNGRNGLGKLSS